MNGQAIECLNCGDRFIPRCDADELFCTGDCAEEFYDLDGGGAV